MKRHAILPGLLMACLGCLVLSTSAQDAAPPAEAEPPNKIELDLDPKVLVFTEPLRDDGTIDYIAALNKHYSQGVTKENNAFRGLYLVLQDVQGAGWDEEAEFAEQIEQALEITQQEMDASPKLTEWSVYAQDRGLTEEEAWAYRGTLFAGDPNPAFVEWLNRSEPTFVQVSAELTKPAYWSPILEGDDAGFLVAAMLPQLGSHRALARALQARAYYAALLGDEDKVIDSLQTIRRLALAQSNEPFLISTLVAISIDALAAKTVKHLLANQLLSDEALGKLAGLWAQRDDRSTIAQSIAMGERCFGLDAYMQFATGRVNSVDWLGGGDREGAVLWRMMRSGELDINRGLKQFSKHYFMISKIAAIQDFAGRQRVSGIFEEQYGSEETINNLFVEFGELRLPNPALLTKDARTDAFTSLLLSILTPATIAAATGETQQLATERCMFAAIACERYRLEQGKLPDALGDLIPAYLKAVPIDPFNNESVRYKVRDDGFTVYAVGRNLRDNGGIENFENRDESDWAFEVTWDEK